MSPVTGRPGSGTSRFDLPAIKKAIMGILASKSFQRSVKVATMALLVLMVYLIASKSMKKTETHGDAAATSAKFAASIAALRTKLATLGTAIREQIFGVLQRFKKQPEAAGIPMPFDASSDNEGWGVCTLRSKRRLGRSSFVQYEFDLPEPDYFLPLDLGQQVSVCCLDNANNVAKGDFFPYQVECKKRLGSFAIGIFSSNSGGIARGR